MSRSSGRWNKKLLSSPNSSVMVRLTMLLCPQVCGCDLFLKCAVAPVLSERDLSSFLDCACPSDECNLCTVEASDVAGHMVGRGLAIFAAKAGLAPLVAPLAAPARCA